VRQLVRPTIGLVVPSLEQGGGVPAVADFVYQAIQRSNKYNIRLVSLSTSASDDLSVAIRRPKSWLQGVQVETGVWRNRPFTRVGVLASELEFRRYMPRSPLTQVLKDCDLIQVVCGSPTWANAVVGLGKPVSLQVATRAIVERRRRDANPSSLAALWRKAMTCVTDRLDDRALRTVDAIQLENPWMLEYSQCINQGRNDVDIRYAPPGVDVALFSPLDKRPSLVNPYILCVGRLDDPRKNISFLLNAFRMLPPSLAHVHLVTAGSGRPPAEYWSKVAEMGLQDRVRHVQRPDTADLVKLYQEAKVFALSSDEEGLGVVILEAMACAIPVVATRCGGPDGIITEGEDGFLVPLDDASVMADRLSILCSDPERNVAMGIAARATILGRYASEVAGQEFVQIWDSLLQKSQGPK
jgi:glycosyltransferase involved in cell wall biosynthesis